MKVLSHLVSSSSAQDITSPAIYVVGYIPCPPSSPWVPDYLLMASCYVTAGNYVGRSSSRFMVLNVSCWASTHF